MKICLPKHIQELYQRYTSAANIPRLGVEYNCYFQAFTAQYFTCNTLGEAFCQYHMSSASICTNSFTAYMVKLFVFIWNKVSLTSICTNSLTAYMVKLFVFVWSKVSSTSTCTNSLTTYAVKLFVFVWNNVSSTYAQTVSPHTQSNYLYLFETMWMSSFSIIWL